MKKLLTKEIFLKESIEYLSTVFLSIVDTYRQVNETPEDVIRRLTPSAMFRQCYNTLCRLYGTERNKENDPEAQEFATKLMKLIQNFPMYVAVSLKELETWTYAPVTKLVMEKNFLNHSLPTKLQRTNKNLLAKN